MNSLVFQGIKAGFLQGYLNEFCCKFFEERVFDRLMITAVGYKSDFSIRYMVGEIADKHIIQLI